MAKAKPALNALADKLDKGVQDVIAKADAAVDEARKEALAVKVAELEAAALKAIPKAVTFKVGGASYEIPASEARETFIALGAESSLWGKWRNLEPDLSEKFSAPECYESKDEPAPYKALLTYLQITSPSYLSAKKSVAELTAKLAKGAGGLTEAEGHILDGAKGRVKEAERAIARAIQALKRHYLSREEVKKGSKRDKPTVRDRAKDFTDLMDKYAADSKESEYDRTLAKRLSAVVANECAVYAEQVKAQRAKVRAEQDAAKAESLARAAGQPA